MSSRVVWIFSGRYGPGVGKTKSRTPIEPKTPKRRKLTGRAKIRLKYGRRHNNQICRDDPLQKEVEKE